MTKDEVLTQILDVLDTIAKVHEEHGRHELNRTDLATALTQVRAVGLAATKPEVQKLF